VACVPLAYGGYYRYKHVRPGLPFIAAVLNTSILVINMVICRPPKLIDPGLKLSIDNGSSPLHDYGALYLDFAVSFRSSRRLESCLGFFALVFVSTLTGCGGSMRTHCLIETCAPNPAEVLYIGSGGPLQTSGQIEAFPIETSNGSLRQTSSITGPLGGMVATSNSAFLYITDSVNSRILGYMISP